MSDGMDGMDGIGWLSYTAVTPRASLKSDANNKCRMYLGSRTEKVCLHLLPPIAGGITENNTNARKKEIQNALVQEKVMFWKGCHIIQESYLICINQLHILCCLFQNFPV